MGENLGLFDIFGFKFTDRILCWWVHQWFTMSVKHRWTHQQMFLNSFVSLSVISRIFEIFLKPLNSPMNFHVLVFLSVKPNSWILTQTLCHSPTILESIGEYKFHRWILLRQSIYQSILISCISYQTLYNSPAI